MAAHFVRIPSELPLRVSHISPKSGLLLSCDFAFRELLDLNAMDNAVSTCLFVFIYSAKGWALELGAGVQDLR